MSDTPNKKRSAEDPDFKAVRPEANIDHLNLSHSPSVIRQGDRFKMVTSALFTDGHTDNDLKGEVFEVSGKSIKHVDHREFDALTPGTSTITVKVGGKTATCKVKVYERVKDEVRGKEDRRVLKEDAVAPTPEPDKAKPGESPSKTSAGPEDPNKTGGNQQSSTGKAGSAADNS